MTELRTQLVIAPYGAPDETSEVNRIDGFYKVEALTVFGPDRAAEPETMGVRNAVAGLGRDAAAQAEALAEVVADRSRAMAKPA